MRLYLLRHGETEWSRAGRKQGRGDSPLTQLGKRQVSACASFLAAEILPDCQVRLLSSPLGRARRSAEIVQSSLNSRVGSFEVLDCLAEHDYGAWEGLTNSEIEYRFPGEQDSRHQNHWKFRIPDGESYELVSKRLERWLSNLDPDTTIIAVAHDIVSRVLRGMYLGLPEKQVFDLTHPHTRVYFLSSGKIEQYDVVAGTA